MEEVAYPSVGTYVTNLHGIIFYNVWIFISTAVETPNFLSLFFYLGSAEKLPSSGFKPSHLPKDT
jgi:hypothetical protein